jgi:nucleotide-binding universal stress UspA family protein
METIVVPTDFTPAANNAVEYAVKLAESLNARIVLVHVFQVPTVSIEENSAMDIVGPLQENARQRLELLKKDIFRRAGREFDIECIAQAGAVYNIIENISVSENADLIVTGIVGEAGKIKEKLFGTTGINLARNQDIPVFIIPEGAKFRPIKKICLACDMDKTEETGLIYIARYFSKLFSSAELEVVYVGNPEERMTVEKDKTHSFIENKLSNTVHRTVHLTNQDPALGLEEYIDTHHPDVVMISPKKHNVFYYLFKKSVTQAVAFNVNVPVLAIH